MGQVIQLPASFKSGGAAKAFAALNPQDDNLADGIGQSYAVIGYKGKQWSLRYRGKRYSFLGDNSFPAPYLDVIILQQAKDKSKSYYPGGFVDGSSERPLCASIDGQVPDLDVGQKQSDACALCSHNVFKVNPATGRKMKECTDYKRLAVLILPTQTKPLLGEALMEPVFLRVPPASLNSLAILGETMADQGYHYSTYVTRITFNPDKAHPEMVFQPIKELTDGEAPVVLKMREDPSAGRIIHGDFSHSEQRLLPSGSTNAFLNPSAEQPASASRAVAIVQPTAQPVTVVQPPAPSDSSGLVDIGFSGAQAAPPKQAAPTTIKIDSGAPEESDAALDERIAALISGR